MPPNFVTWYCSILINSSGGCTGDKVKTKWTNFWFSSTFLIWYTGLPERRSGLRRLWSLRNRPNLGTGPRGRLKCYSNSNPQRLTFSCFVLYVHCLFGRTHQSELCHPFCISDKYGGRNCLATWEMTIGNFTLHVTVIRLHYTTWRKLHTPDCILNFGKLDGFLFGES